MLLMKFDSVPWRIGFIFAIYLIFKAVMFFHDFASILDLVVGV